MNNKKYSIVILLLATLALFSLMAFTTYRAKVINPIIELPTKGIVTIPLESLTVDSIELVVSSHQAFLDAIGFRESGNRYDVANRYGYMGKYQFGKKTLKGLGIKVTQDEFLNSPYIQEKAMYALLKQNKRSLRKYIEKYDFIDDNPSIMILDGHYVNDPHIIGLNDNQVSINSTLEIDLTGQCCSESIGTRHFSGTGGQTDTAVGAQNAKNGRSFISLYSTAWLRNKETGEKEEVSKIVTTLKPGAAVSLSRNDVDFVVTEYGMVSLRGKNIRERAKLLISIAHPKFRDELTKEAIKVGFINEHF